jgi:hypothetical protein
VKVETLKGDNSFACDNCWKLKKAYNERKNETNGIDNVGDTDDVSNTDHVGDTGDTGDAGDAGNIVDTNITVNTVDSNNIAVDSNNIAVDSNNIAVDTNNTVNTVDTTVNTVNIDTDNTENTADTDNIGNNGNTNIVDAIAGDTGDTGDTGGAGDTGDAVDAVDAGDAGDISDNKDDQKTNGLEGSEVEEASQENDSSHMEDVVYNNDTENRRSEVETSSRMDNENSSDTSDGKRNSTEFESSTPPKSKSVSEPERQYVLRKAYKRYLFDSLPPVMVFHLKRFQQVGSRWSVSMSMRKIDDFVSFDEELDIGDFVVPPEIEEKNENAINTEHDSMDSMESPSKNKQHKLSTKYRLYGVVVHLGNLYNGHYIAYVLSRNIRGEGEQYGISSYLSNDVINRARDIGHKTDDQRQWIYCSDSSVRAVSVDEVLKSGAYLLFYERVYE